MGLVPVVVGEASTGVTPLVGLPTTAVGVVPVAALGEPPHAAMSASKPSNNKPNQALSGDPCVLFGMFSFFPNIPRGIDERDFDNNSSTRNYCTRLHNKWSMK